MGRGRPGHAAAPGPRGRPGQRGTRVTPNVPRRPWFVRCRTEPTPPEAAPPCLVAPARRNATVPPRRCVANADRGGPAPRRVRDAAPRTCAPVPAGGVRVRTRATDGKRLFPARHALARAARHECSTTKAGNRPRGAPRRATTGHAGPRRRRQAVKDAGRQRQSIRARPPRKSEEGLIPNIARNPELKCALLEKPASRAACVSDAPAPIERAAAPILRQSR